MTAAIKVQARLYIIEILKMFSKKTAAYKGRCHLNPLFFLPLALQTLTGLSTRLPTTMKLHSQRRKRQVGSVVRVRFTRNLKYSFQKGVVTFLLDVLSSTTSSNQFLNVAQHKNRVRMHATAVAFICDMCALRENAEHFIAGCFVSIP